MYVGDLTDVLETHWSADVNEKTHAFWSHNELTDCINLTFGDVDITVAEVGEYNTSSHCPGTDYCSDLPVIVATG